MGQEVREPMGLVWEEIRTQIRAADSSPVKYYTFTLRARVPGGWLVWTTLSEGSGLTFYPDPEHKWDV